MPMLGSAKATAERGRDAPDLRTKGQIEAEISKAMIRFKREQLGRGPADIRTQIVQDLVIVRMADMLTTAERTLVRAGGEELLKQVRAKLLASEHEALDRLLWEVTGCEVVSIYSDLNPETGERIIVFVLRESPKVRWE